MTPRLRFVAACYAGIGVAALVAPSRVPATFGGTAATADSRTEVRAVYGGLPLAMAASLLLAPDSARWVRLASLGMAAGRTAGVALEGTRPSPATIGFGVLEVVLAAASRAEPVR